MQVHAVVITTLRDCVASGVQTDSMVILQKVLGVNNVPALAVPAVLKNQTPKRLFALTAHWVCLVSRNLMFYSVFIL